MAIKHILCFCVLTFYMKKVLIFHKNYLIHYCGWNVPWTCFHNTYPTGSPVWFCNFPLWLMAIGTSSSTDVWHHNGSAGNTRPPINMRHGPGDRALWEKRRRGERCRLVGSCVSVCECMWCFWLPSVGWISYKGLLWFLFSSFCLSVVTHSTHFSLMVWPH